VKLASDTIYPLHSFDSCPIILNYVNDEYTPLLQFRFVRKFVVFITDDTSLLQPIVRKYNILCYTIKTDRNRWYKCAILVNSGGKRCDSWIPETKNNRIYKINYVLFVFYWGFYKIRILNIHYYSYIIIQHN